MKIISYAWTVLPMLAGVKTCTRRAWTPEYARSFKAGDQAWGYNRNARIGGKAMATVRLTAAPVLSTEYPDSDYEAEGLGWMERHGLLVPLTVKGKKYPMQAREFWRRWKKAAPALYQIRFELVSRTEAGEHMLKAFQESRALGSK